MDQNIFMPDKTFASIDLVLSDIKRLCRFLDVFVNLLFIFLYVYAIIGNLEHPILLSINILLLVISLAYFVLHAVTFWVSGNRYERIVNHHVGRAVRYFKIAVKLFTLGLSLYELLRIEYTDLKLCIFAVTAAAFFMQVIFEIGRFLFEKYVAVIKAGIMMDIEEFKASSAGKTILKVADGVKNPRAFLAEELSSSIQRIRLGKAAEAEEVPTPKKLSKTARKIEARALRLQDEKAQKAQEEARESKARTENAFALLKENVTALFKGDKK